MTSRKVTSKNWNTVYMLSALGSTIMALAVGIQPLFLDQVLQIPFEEAGTINANIQVVVEILSLILIGYFGYLSDRYGRIPVVVFGFLIAATGALLAPFSPELGAVLGIGGLVVYYLTRILMSLGADAVQLQMTTLAGDFTTYNNRARFMTNTVFMMTFGSTIIYAVMMQIPKQEGGIWIVMLAPAAIGLLGAWVAKNFLVDNTPRLEEEERPWKRVWNLAANDPRMLLCFASAFYTRADMVFIGLFYMLWSISFADVVGLSRTDAVGHAGLMIGLTGVMVLICIPFWSRFIENHSRIAAIGAGLSMSGAGFIFLALFVNPFEWGVVLPLMLIGAGQAGCLVAPRVLISDLAPNKIQGSVQGAFNVAGGIGIVLLVQSGGYFFDAVGPRSPFVLTATGNLLVMGYAIWLLYNGVDESPKHILQKLKKTDLKPLVFMTCLLPLIWLLGRVAVSGMLPGTGVDEMPVGFFNRYLGDWALNFLILSLAMRPLRELTGANKIAKYSRMIGLYAFFYATLHVLVYVWFQWDLNWGEMAKDIAKREFIIVGILAYMILLPLAITSYKKLVQTMGGRNWKKLHRSVYVLDVVVVLHFMMAAEPENGEPYIYGTLVALLLGYRARNTKWLAPYIKMVTRKPATATPAKPIGDDAREAAKKASAAE
ncbi:magnetosome biogenesis transporter MamZ [Magnetospira sp. QH-2]|uniref:magnetosome biogenesis transporter MamZ n=1 Tax=Magnetospira sp. (strain QH-2) TaxID=1288970 RepID=UPI0003E80DD2|nr:magnetosome biogenesis transporter MamZ [Magnetospira sp. QH-2]CCQ72979.1 putative magnetosome protein MamZ similar to MamH [Magnetospira sp. QH-2]